MSNKGILIITACADGILPGSAAEQFGAARLVSPESDITAAVIGTGAPAAAEAAGNLGVARVLTAETAETAAVNLVATAVAAVTEVKPCLILLADDDLGRDLAPLLAASLKTATVTDAVGLRTEEKATIITRLVYGGNAMADFIIDTEPGIVTIRPKAFEPISIPAATPVISELPTPGAGDLKVTEHHVIEAEGPRLEDARIVVGGGRGLGGPEGFAQLKSLADLVGGSVGASRPPVDQDWWPESGQIGITGKIIAPDLYIAVGISGSSQHVSGITGAKTVVAVNKDPEANIFNAATYGIVGDWKKVLPALTAKIRELTGK